MSVKLVVAGGVMVIVPHVITRLYVVPIPVQLLASVATTVMGKAPNCVGVPESTPFEASVNPVGKVLEVVNATVPIPPLCVKVWLNAVPEVPVVIVGFVTVIVWQPITSVYVAPVPIHPLLSVAFTVMGNEPVCVGVPDNVPFEASVKPVGNVLEVLNVVVPMPPLCMKD